MLLRSYIFARGVANFFHCDTNRPTILENDNQAVLMLANSPMIGKGVRHSDVRTHFFKDTILKGIIQQCSAPNRPRRAIAHALISVSSS